MLKTFNVCKWIPFYFLWHLMQFIHIQPPVFLSLSVLQPDVHKLASLQVVKIFFCELVADIITWLLGWMRKTQHCIISAFLHKQWSTNKISLVSKDSLITLLVWLVWAVSGRPHIYSSSMFVQDVPWALCRNKTVIEEQERITSLPSSERMTSVSYQWLSLKVGVLEFVWWL